MSHVSPQLGFVWPAPLADEPLRFQRIAMKHVQALLVDGHYLHSLPGDPVFTFAWFLGMNPVACATFSSPANRYFGPGSLELTRLVRSDACQAPLTSFLAQCVRVIRADERRFKLLVSYADSSAGHHGGIYQAFNGIHVAASSGHGQWKHRETGKIVSERSMSQSALARTTEYERVRTGMKYLYAWPLHEGRKALLQRFGWEALPYPKPSLP